MPDNRIITVLSGKGGTGKTTVAAALASAADNSYYIDCDVEEPNGKFFIRPNIKQTYEFKQPVPRINEENCTFCGKCADLCEYSAISIIKNSKRSFVFDELCHSCGVCWSVCPADNAISKKFKAIGRVHIGLAKNREEESFREGLLNIGEPSGVPLVNHLLEDIDKEKKYIIDAPPGTSCPVVASLIPSDLALVVTEPTPFGINDMELTLELIEHMDKRGAIIINKSRSENREIEDIAERHSMPVIGEILYSRDIAIDYSDGVLNSNMLETIKEIAGRIYE